MALLDKLTSGSSTPPDTSGMSKQAKLVCELVADFNSNNLLTQIRNNNRSKSDIDKTYKYPDHFTSELIETKNFKMELLKWKNSHNPYVVLQIAGLYSELGKGASVLSIDYRVAPENPYPAALNDALYAYDWLLNHGYSENHIILAGDSAGGGLAMALCHYLTDRDIDPLFGNTNESLIYNSVYPGNHDLTDPYISPLFGDFTGFPPMLIQVGSNEMLLSDSVLVAEKAKSQGVKVRLSIYENMFHVFQMGMTLMPESKKAWVEVSKFLEQMMIL